MRGRRNSTNIGFSNHSRRRLCERKNSPIEKSVLPLGWSFAGARRDEQGIRTRPFTSTLLRDARTRTPRSKHEAATQR